MRKILFVLKQMVKILIQNCVLPLVYFFWSIIYIKKKKTAIVFADAHHSTVPFSMQRIRQAVLEKGYKIVDYYYDTASLSQLEVILKAIRFMRIYAQAGYVFICDNFLAVSSCAKRKQTKVIQLWHACGLIKKMGYDTKEDIPKFYIGDVYKNYDIVTVSSKACEPVLTRAMKQHEGVVKALGVSRTDSYFDPEWVEDCKKEFYEKYPEAKNKKIILWAPTYRGNAGDPQQVGLQSMKNVEKHLGDSYFLIYKVHPHVDAKYKLSNCSIQTERLFPVIDLLVSDYSTVITEYLFFNKPYVLFSPDLSEYERNRGFYVEYETLSKYIVTDVEKLQETMKIAMEDSDLDWNSKCRTIHISACDGKATERILKTVGLE